MERLKIYTFIYRYINVCACVCVPVMNSSVAAFKQFGCVSKHCVYIMREETNEGIMFKKDNGVTLNYLNKCNS